MIIATLLSSWRDLPGDSIDEGARHRLAMRSDCLGPILDAALRNADMNVLWINEGFGSAAFRWAAINSAWLSLKDPYLETACFGFHRDGSVENPRALQGRLWPRMESIPGLKAMDELLCGQAEAAVRAWTISAHPDAPRLAALAYAGVERFSKVYDELHAIAPPPPPEVKRELADRFASLVPLLFSPPLDEQPVRLLMRRVTLPVIATALAGGPNSIISAFGERCSNYGRRRLFEELPLRAEGPVADIRRARREVVAKLHDLVPKQAM